MSGYRLRGGWDANRPHNLHDHHGATRHDTDDFDDGDDQHDHDYHDHDHRVA